MLCDMGYARTNIYLSKPQKAAWEKIAKEKGLTVAELVRRIIDKELDRGQKQKELTTNRRRLCWLWKNTTPPGGTGRFVRGIPMRIRWTLCQESSIRSPRRARRLRSAHRS